MSAANAPTMAGDAKEEIDIRRAVKIAREYVRDAFEGHVDDLRLEETEFADFENRWRITLSFLRDKPASEQMPMVFADLSRGKMRDYKIVDIDAHDGRVYSMKIRKV